MVAREHDEKLAKLGDRGAHAYRSHANCCPTATLGDRRKTGAPWADRCGNCEKEPSASACCSDLRVGRVAKHPKTSRAPGSGERTGNGERDREGARSREGGRGRGRGREGAASARAVVAFDARRNQCAGRRVYRGDPFASERALRACPAEDTLCPTGLLRLAPCKARAPLTHRRASSDEGPPAKHWRGAQAFS